MLCGEIAGKTLFIKCVCKLLHLSVLEEVGRHSPRGCHGAQKRC